MNKASGGEGIPAELFQILKHDAVKVLHSICQQIWKTQHGPRTGKGQFSLQSQRTARPKNAQTTTQLYSSHTKMSSIKDRKGMDLTEAEDIKKRWQEYTEELYKKDLHNPDNHNGVIAHLEPDILE